ncbi:hypothetical protein DNTS_035180 [Danionella cerebrum]|uniref:Uncharacterized protein n=1 Tax=Danionella cerebrum TaxID=2873325 RepID=A0A553NLQ9_9TELE|nr:hypothetical protein DNTS_035180 [Danionella translucida]
MDRCEKGGSGKKTIVMQRRPAQAKQPIAAAGGRSSAAARTRSDPSYTPQQQPENTLTKGISEAHFLAGRAAPGDGTDLY